MEKQYPLSMASHIRPTLALGLPLIGSSIAQFSLHVVNTIMVGWYGVIPLAALVIGTSAYFIFYVFGSGFARAVMPLAAQAQARGDSAELRRAARMGLWLSIAFALLVYPFFWFSEGILIALGQKPEVAAEAQSYLRIVGLGLFPNLAVAVLQGWLAALGRTQLVLWVTVAAVGLNAVSNWFLIFGNGGAPELGVAGAALSSLTMHILTLLVLGLYAGLLPALRPHQLYRRFWKLDAPAMRQVFMLGWPIGLTGVAEASLFQASALMMGWLGAVQLAAHGIALEITAMAFMVHVGLSNAATIRVAGYAGLGQAKELRDAALIAIMMSLAVAFITIVIFVSIPEQIVGLFLNEHKPDSAAILVLGSSLLLLAALFQLADAMQALALGLLRGIQDTKVPLILAVIAYWLIGIPVSYTLGFVFGFGAIGLWLGLVSGLAAACIALMWRFWRLAPKVGAAG